MAREAARKPLPSGALFNATCIQLSLGRLLPSRACLRFTGYYFLAFLIRKVNHWLWGFMQLHSLSLFENFLLSDVFVSCPDGLGSICHLCG